GSNRIKALFVRCLDGLYVALLAQQFKIKPRADSGGRKHAPYHEIIVYVQIAPLVNFLDKAREEVARLVPIKPQHADDEIRSCESHPLRINAHKYFQDVEC